MDKKILKIYENIQNLFYKFADSYEGKEHGELIRHFVDRDSTFNKISELLKGNNFNSKAIFQIIEPMFAEMLGDDPVEDWLFYAYQYALSLSFEAAITIPLYHQYDKHALFILEYMRIFFNEQKGSTDRTWQSMYPLKLLTEHELEGNKTSDYEYKKFMKSFDKDYVYEMMKLNQDVVGYSTLDHISGVHHLAVKIAKQLKVLGLPIDISRVSGAAAGHDIGKFGCKKSEARRVAYYHYYYTGEWFEKRNIVYIRNVAINHSTWDLELDNLSLESLILIYSDFRVKNNEDRESPYKMKYYTLDEAFEVILDKLDNVDQAKEDRYRKVYERLKDFENYMILKKVCLGADGKDALCEGHIQDRQYFSLMQGDEVVENSKFLSIRHNIGLMNKLRDETSLNAMLENARGLENQISLRGYLDIIEEYFAYLTQKQKLITMKFLYERLMLPAEDIRTHAAQLIGTLIASFDEEMRKEIPDSVQEKKPEITSQMLFDNYLAKFLYPDQKIIGKHKSWIGNSLQYMIESLLKLISKDEIEGYLNIFAKYLKRDNSNRKHVTYMINCINLLYFENMNHGQVTIILKWLNRYTDSQDMEIRLMAFDVLVKKVPYINERTLDLLGVKPKLRRLTSFAVSQHPAENYMRFKMVKNLDLGDERRQNLRAICIADLERQSDIFLSNLKSATHWVTKKLQVELLVANIINVDEKDSFYTAMHLWNLLKVSAHEQVRNAAGRGLIELSPYLSKEQINDIVVELLRALEMESYQYTKYIPEYLGCCCLILGRMSSARLLITLWKK